MMRIYVPFKSFGKDSHALEILKEKFEVVGMTGERPDKNELKKIAKDIIGYFK